MDRVKQMFSPQANAAPAPVPAPPAPASDQLLAALDETLAFLDAHRDSHLLLETIELDIMSHAGEAELKACVDAEIVRCRHAGAALDALPANVDEAARALRTAVAGQAAEPLDAFHGLRLDNDFDSTRTGATERPMGLYWSDVLYFNCSTAASSKRICSRAELAGQGRPAGPGRPVFPSRAPCPAPVPANPARVNRAGFVTHLQSVTMPAACSGRHVAHR